MQPNPRLSAPAYYLGEVESNWDCAMWRERAELFGMQPDPNLWGWGSVRVTEHSAAEMAVRSILQTLTLAGCDPANIDALIICSMRLPVGAEEQQLFIRSIMEPCGLTQATPYGVTLGRCATFLQGIALARSLVLSNTYRRVVVVTVDRVTNEPERLESFALFSDGAASCLVAHEDVGTSGYQIMACTQILDLKAPSNAISPELSKIANARLFRERDIGIEDIERVLHTNLYLPICTVKERQAGFLQHQLYTDNIQRIGHCFAADPIINLVDLADAGGTVALGHYILSASVPGARVAIMLRRDD